METNGLGNLRTFVALEGGDTHLGHDLEDAETNRSLVAAEVLLDVALLRQLSITLEFHDGLVSVVWAHGIRSESEEEAMVVDLVWLPRVHDEGCVHPQLLPHERLVHRAGAEQRRQWCPIAGHRSVGEHDNLAVAEADGVACFMADTLEVPVQRLAALVDWEGGVNSVHVPALVPVDAIERINVGWQEARMLEPEALAMRW
mmetsp:Transcript_71801/g.198203  ORF Transcript_71801/g.198203 Transcript_71801/m.198203 type:complete len:201 (+) Transcript_71801:218-820(+)